MKKANIYYPIQVWLLSILGGPIFLTLGEIFNAGSNQDIFDAIGYYFILIPFASIYSIPTLLISYVSFRLLLKYQVKVIVIKGILILLGLTFFALTLDLISGPIRDIADMSIHISYSFFFLLGSFLYKIKHRTEAPTSSNRVSGIRS